MNNIEYISFLVLELGLLCLMLLLTIFQLHRGGQFYCWRTSEYSEKTTNMLQVTDKLFNILLYQVHLVMIGIRTHNVNGNRH
jgi:hypothetical protein